MRKPVIVVVDWSTALAYEGQKGTMSLKVNDEVCACNCEYEIQRRHNCEQGRQLRLRTPR
jgi:hypothetical protein